MSAVRKAGINDLSVPDIPVYGTLKKWTELRPKIQSSNI